MFSEKRGPREKRGISLLVSYVLLIGIAIALSAAVWAWLKYYVERPIAEEACPEGVNIILYDYNCSDGVLNLTVQNKGRFRIDGYVAKGNKEVKGIAGRYRLNEIGKDNIINVTLNPGDTFFAQFNYSDVNFEGEIAQIELEPFRITNETKAYCDEAILTQKISCPKT